MSNPSDEVVEDATTGNGRVRKPRTRPTNDIRYLWALRILVPLRGHVWLFEDEEVYACDQVAQLVGLPHSVSKADLPARLALLREAWRNAEGRAGQFRLHEPFASNLNNLCRFFGFNGVERQVLGLALMASFDPIFDSMVSWFRVLEERILDPWARILAIPVAQVRCALLKRSRLGRADLFQMESSLKLATIALQVNRPELAGVYKDRLWNPTRLIEDCGRVAPAPELARSDYQHIATDIDIMIRYLRQALGRRRKGVNILLHGMPGSGKTQLGRLLGKELAATVFEVASSDRKGDCLDGDGRFKRLTTLQKLMSQGRALIVFDEIDQVFADGNRHTRNRTSADLRRPWLVDVLEGNRCRHGLCAHVPTPALLPRPREPQALANRHPRPHPSATRRMAHQPGALARPGALGGRVRAPRHRLCFVPVDR